MIAKFLQTHQTETEIYKLNPKTYFEVTTGRFEVTMGRHFPVVFRLIQYFFFDNGQFLIRQLHQVTKNLQIH